MGFEKFKFMDRELRSKVTIRETGHIGFTTGAVNRFNIEEYSYCELYYDKESNKIGMKLLKEGELDSITKIIKKENNCYISSRPFFDYYGIPYHPSQSFIAVEDDESGLIIIDLKKPLPSKKLKRKEEKVIDDK